MNHAFCTTPELLPTPSRPNRTALAPESSENVKVIDDDRFDRLGRRVTLRAVGDDWLAIADVAPHDNQRDFVPALAARYMLVNARGGPWTSMGVYADEEVTGHVMWALDDDNSYWIGGLVIDRLHQGAGLGRAAVELLTSWFAARPDFTVTRLSYEPRNVVAAALYESLGFAPNGDWVGDELVVEKRLPQ